MTVEIADTFSAIHVNNHEFATTNIAGFGKCHDQCQSGGDRGIHGVSTVTENLFADCRTIFVGRLN